MKLVNAIGLRLQNIMKEKGANYYRLQRDGGVDRSVVADVAQAKYQTVSVNILYQILSTLGVSLSDFFADPLFDDISD